jgi:hypothetical protein
MPLRFRLRDLKRALQAVKDVGLMAERVEIDPVNGKVSIVVGADRNGVPPISELDQGWHHMRVRLKGVHPSPKKLADGRTITYYYEWKGRGAPRLEGEPGSPEFIASYHAALAQRAHRRPAGSHHGLRPVIGICEVGRAHQARLPAHNQDHREEVRAIPHCWPE